MAKTPQVIEESAILNTGLKNTSDSPGLIGDQSGHWVLITGNITYQPLCQEEMRNNRLQEETEQLAG